MNAVFIWPILLLAFTLISQETHGKCCSYCFSFETILVDSVCFIPYSIQNQNTNRNLYGSFIFHCGAVIKRAAMSLKIIDIGLRTSHG